MRTLYLLLSFFLVLQLSAQTYSIKGKVTDAQTNEPLPGANIILETTYQGSYSGTNGEFYFKNLTSDMYILRISYIGYNIHTDSINLCSDTMINVSLFRKTLLTDEVVVYATKAKDNSPIAHTNLSKEEISEQNVGYDMPVLLQNTPSVVVTSDAGNGVGYTGIRIRGSDPTRVNVTINGIPLNDAESQGTYWVDLPDFASSVDNIQIQRGIGSSTNGAGAFGGSLNLQTNTLSQKAYAWSNHSYGSFNTLKNTIAFGSGLLNDKFTFDGRLSKISSDGYVDRATSNLKSYYFSTGYYGKNNILRLNIFSGKERTYQSWYGLPEDSLTTNRTYNFYTYDNEVDDYQQDHYQLIYSQNVTDNWNLNTALHYTKGKGYYEQYEAGAALSNFGLQDVIIGTDTITSTDLIQRQWLDNDFYGVTYSLNYDSKKKINFTLGGAWNQYLGGHFGEIIWAQYASNSNINYQYYNNDATKNDFNIFSKVGCQLTNKLNAFVDLQFRNVKYSFLGFDNQFNNAGQTVSLNFVNPKVGFNYMVNNNQRVYGFYGIGRKEPNRNDYTQSTPNSRPKPEELRDLELGYSIQSKKSTLTINSYYMDYKNQLVLTGEINDVGAYNRTNIEKSYRAGVELSVGYKPKTTLELLANVTLSQNKIKNFNEYIDQYDSIFNYTGQVANQYVQTDIAFSPNIISSGQIIYTPVKNLSLNLISRYIGSQYLDNTSNSNRQINAYWINDFRTSYTLKNKIFSEIRVAVLVNNLLNKLYESNGYTFSYAVEGETYTENYYYPQAGRNFMVNLNLKF